MPFAEKTFKRSVEGFTLQQMEAIKSVINSTKVKIRHREIMPLSDGAWTKKMRAVVSEFREKAKGCSDDEIESIADEAVQAVRMETRGQQY